MFLVSLYAIALGGPSQAQSRIPAATADATGILAGARRALNEGRAEEAAVDAGEILARDPVNRQAADLAIGALLQQRKRDQALSTYDIHVAARGQADAELLRTIARADLRSASQQQADLQLKVTALEALAAAGDVDALRALKQVAAARPAVSLDDLAPLVSLARLGDADAVSAVGRFLDSASADTKAQAIFLIGDAGLQSLSGKLLPLLDDSDPVVQASAARVLGRLQVAEAVPRLQVLFTSDVPLVRMSAGVALKRLGQTTADAYIAELMQRRIPELRLIAIEACQTSPSTQWLEGARQLLNDPNEGTQLAAAALTASADPEGTRRVLLAALGSHNPLARAEAARILDSAGLADASVIRQMLSDSFEPLRVRAAAAAVRPTAAR